MQRGKRERYVVGIFAKRLSRPDVGRCAETIRFVENGILCLAFCLIRSWDLHYFHQIYHTFRNIQYISLFFKKYIFGYFFAVTPFYFSVLWYNEYV